MLMMHVITMREATTLPGNLAEIKVIIHITEIIVQIYGGDAFFKTLYLMELLKNNTMNVRHNTNNMDGTG